MALRLQGLTYREIGARVHRSAGTVEHWFRHDDTFRAAYAALRAEQVAIGLKPTERREVTGVGGGPVVIRWESGDVADLG
jgi:transposase